MSHTLHLVPNQRRNSLIVFIVGFVFLPRRIVTALCIRTNKRDQVRLQQMNRPLSRIHSDVKMKNNIDGNGDNPTPKPPTTIYKDDCFGFTTFIAGIAVQDFKFTGIFVSLSLLADILTRLDVLPPDSMRPEIVDRKVPGVIAVLTLLLNTFVSHSKQLGDLDANMYNTQADGMNIATKVQLAICSFSIVTSFLDIRWRDRFDYPE